MVIGSTENVDKIEWRCRRNAHLLNFTGKKRVPSNRHIYLLGEVGSRDAQSLIQAKVCEPFQIIIVNNDRHKIPTIKRQNPGCMVICGSLYRVLLQHSCYEWFNPIMVDYDSQTGIAFGNRKLAFNTISKILYVVPNDCMVSANVPLNHARSGHYVDNRAARTIVTEFRKDIEQAIPYFYQRFYTKHPIVYRGEGCRTTMGTMYFYKRY